MTVTELHVAALRALLAHQFEEHRGLLAQISKGSFNAGYRALVAAAFFEAVDQRFANKGTTVNDVVEYVAEIRAISDESDGLDPILGERMVRVVLGDETVSIPDVGGGAKFAWQAVLTASLIADEEYGDSDLDSFLAKARVLAEEWTLEEE